MLGSINLAEFVKNEFKPNAYFDFDSFKNTVDIAVSALNEVLDEGLPKHPLLEQQESVRDWRQIGLGVMGIADMLIKLGIKYGEDNSLEICEKIAYCMANQSLLSSAKLAKELGSFPKCNINQIMSTLFFSNNSSSDTVDYVSQHGLRNSQLLTCAPTGSISTMVGVSGGIEPIFANYYTRKTESLHGEDVFYKIYTPIAQRYMKEFNVQELPDFFVESHSLSYEQRIKMQSTWQRHIDASISSTINLSNDTTQETIFDLYIKAWENGLKGLTIYRDGCKRSGILTTDDSVKEVVDDTVKYDTIIPTSRKTMERTYGTTYCKKSACGTLYITINKDDENNIVESFVNTSKGGICQANIGAINRMISVALRSGTKVAEIVDQLKGINCSACVKNKAKGEHIDGLSCPDILARTLLDFYQTTPHINTDNSSDKCPDCGHSIRHESGCVICLECGYSKCD